MTSEQEEFIKTLKTIKDYPLDKTKDIEYFETLEQRYPQLDLVEAIKKFAAYKLDKPLTKKSNPRSQMNDSFKNYTEWGTCLKKLQLVKPANQKSASDLEYEAYQEMIKRRRESGLIQPRS
ncbi:MAG: hypothetical protein JM58_09575 [Peptococcaceae bacterium BICA1-8]|nr:MAG: hypothetical protein JM58_09575 [Peptococcaceae bacterium BICA1-8]